MTPTIPLIDDPLDLIKRFVAALLTSDANASNEIVKRMVTVAMNTETPVLSTGGKLEPEIRHKAKVTELMGLARQLRSAPSDLYDVSYKALQDALYDALQTHS